MADAGTCTEPVEVLVLSRSRSIGKKAPVRGSIQVKGNVNAPKGFLTSFGMTKEGESTSAEQLHVKFTYHYQAGYQLVTVTPARLGGSLF